LLVSIGKRVMRNHVDGENQASPRRGPRAGHTLRAFGHVRLVPILSIAGGILSSPAWDWPAPRLDACSTGPLPPSIFLRSKPNLPELLYRPRNRSCHGNDPRDSSTPATRSPPVRAGSGPRDRECPAVSRSTQRMPRRSDGTSLSGFE
jgi:hypothetical protein